MRNCILVASKSKLTHTYIAIMTYCLHDQPDWRDGERPRYRPCYTVSQLSGADPAQQCVPYTQQFPQPGSVRHWRLYQRPACLPPGVRTAGLHAAQLSLLSTSGSGLCALHSKHLLFNLVTDSTVFRKVFLIKWFRF